MGLCEDGTKQRGFIEGGQCVDKLNNCDVFSEDSVGRHFVILFCINVDSFSVHIALLLLLLLLDYVISEEHNCLHIQGRLRRLRTFILNVICPPT